MVWYGMVCCDVVWCGVVSVDGGVTLQCGVLVVEGATDASSSSSFWAACCDYDGCFFDFPAANFSLAFSCLRDFLLPGLPSAITLAPVERLLA